MRVAVEMDPVHGAELDEVAGIEERSAARLATSRMRVPNSNDFAAPPTNISPNQSTSSIGGGATTRTAGAAPPWPASLR